MRQSYICDQCGVESHVDLSDDPDFREAVSGICADHCKWSPECTATQVRILDVDDSVRRYYVDLSQTQV